MGQFQFGNTRSSRRRVNWKLAIRENRNPVGQITIGYVAQNFIGVDTTTITMAPEVIAEPKESCQKVILHP